VSESTYRLTGLRARNFLKLKAVELEFSPETASITVAGENRAGKSACIAALWSALGGKREVPKVPVRDGEALAEIEVDLTECDESGKPLSPPKIVKVARTIRPDRETSLRVRGLYDSTPQAMLDDLLDALAFDPSEVVRMKPAQLAKLAKKLAGLTEPIAEVDEQISDAFEARKEAKAEFAAVEAQLPEEPPEPFPPPKYNRAEISRLLVDNQKAIQHKADIDGKLQTALNTVDREERECHRIEERIKDLQAQLKGLKKELKEQAEVARQTVESAAILQKKVDEFPKFTGLDEIESFQETTEEYEQRCREIAAYKKQGSAVDDKQRALNRAEETLETLRANKRQILSEAEYPVPGLELDFEGNLVYNGLPFDQSSSAESLIAACQMVAKMKPKLRLILLKEASFLDENSQSAIIAWAEENRFVVWLELATSDKEAAEIFIEDGEIVKEAL